MTAEGTAVVASDRGLPRLDAQARARAEWWLFARLAITGLSFGIAVGLEGPAGELSDAAREGLLFTVALGFLATGVSGALVRRVARLDLFVLAQVVVDVAIVTSLVHFTGGRESLFAFLYIVATVYGALLFERWGALGAATLSACCYGAVLWAQNGGGPETVPVAALGAIWGVHVGAMYLVGALASVLSRELRRTGQALYRSQNDLQRLQSLHQRTVESIMSGLLTTDSRGAITSFNPEAERITGWAVAEALGVDVEDVIPGVRDVVMSDRSARGPADSPRARLGYRNRPGSELYLGLAGSILRDEDGEAVGHVVIFQDVTQVVAMERQLRRSERLAAVGEMSAKMAHEIRNPLAAISGSVQVLRSGTDAAPGSEAQRLMDIVVREADRLNGLIHDFLQYARPHAPSLQEVSLDALVDDVLELFESSRPESVRVEVERGPRVIALADPDQLEQVLWNLVLNAAEAMPEGGVLGVRVAAIDRQPPQGGAAERRNEDEGNSRQQSCASSWAEIAVSDTGVGIPLDVQEQIFEPFFTTKKEGSGLGLSTVHRIVETHGGMLQVESREDEGTTFRVWLPLAGASQ